MRGWNLEHGDPDFASLTIALAPGESLWEVHGPGDDGVVNACAAWTATEPLVLELATRGRVVVARAVSDEPWSLLEPLSFERSAAAAIVLGRPREALTQLRSWWPDAPLELTGIHRRLEVAAGGDLDVALAANQIYATATVETRDGERFVVHNIKTGESFGAPETVEHRGRAVPLAELRLVEQVEPVSYPIAWRWLRERDEARDHGDRLAMAVDAALKEADAGATRAALREYCEAEGVGLRLRCLEEEEGA